MANSKSALKNIRKNKARYIRNRAVTSRLKTLEKHFISAVEGLAEVHPVVSAIKMMPSWAKEARKDFAKDKPPIIAS